MPELNVLVVDDNEDICEVLQVALTASGYSVGVARDYETAIQLLGQSAPRVVFMDYYIDGFDSSSFINEVRARHAKTRIVLMTAAKDGREKANGLGLEHLLEKPFELSAVLKIATAAGASPIKQQVRDSMTVSMY